MSCQTVRKSLSDFLDQRLAEEERSRLSQHLSTCRQCAARWSELTQVRNLLQSAPVRRVPAHLTSRLQVLASHERFRRLATSSIRACTRYCLGRLSLIVDNLMRPFAVPFAGGLVSALFLFTMLVPNLSFTRNLRNDVPIALYTEATVDETSPFSFTEDETEVELTIGSDGQISDYSCPHGRITRELVANIGNTILFSSFTPATMFGRPTSGKVRIVFRRQGGWVIVRG